MSRFGVPWVAAALAIAVLPASAQVKITEVMDLRAAFPFGARRGENVDVLLVGKHITDPSRLLIEGDGVRVESLTGVGPTEARVRLAIAPDAPVGRVAMRLVGKFGVTDPIPFVISDLPEEREQEPNSGMAEPNRIASLPRVVCGQFNPAEDLDRFRFRATRGRPVTIAVESFVLDATHSVGESRGRRNVDPVMRLFGPTGKRIAECEDFHTPDPLIVLRPEEDGEYVVELQDLGYEGNPAASYRLTVTEQPWLTALYPAGGRRGSVVPVEGISASGEVLSGTATARTAGKLQFDTLAGAVNTRPFLVSDLPEALEREPNDKPVEANPATVGSVFNGRLARAGDTDGFALTLRAGESISVEVMADRELHSPVDLMLTVLGEDGRQIAQSDDSQLAYGLESRDPELQFTAPRAGLFTFVLKEMAGRGGPDCVYRATVKPLTRGFHLTTWWDNVLLKGPGGTGALLGLVRRELGFKGAVRVRVAGLPPGYAGAEGIITPAQTSVLLTITAPPDAKVGDVVPFYLEGEADVDGVRQVRRAIPRAQRDQDGETIWKPSTGCLAAVGPVTEFQLRTPVRELVGKPGETVIIPLEIDRVAGYDAAFAVNAVQCIFTLGGSPAEFRANMPVPQGVRKLDFRLELPANLKPGDYTFAIIRGMGHDYRIDRPYPSTPLIHLKVPGADL